MPFKRMSFFGLPLKHSAITLVELIQYQPEVHCEKIQAAFAEPSGRWNDIDLRDAVFQ